MSVKGVLQLSKLTIQYCKFGGSSIGVRCFAEDILPRLRKEHPHIEVETAHRPGRHPKFYGLYAHGGVKTVSVRNYSVKEVLTAFNWLRTEDGHKVRKVKTLRQESKQPSIQGRWTPETWSN